MKFNKKVLILNGTLLAIFGILGVISGGPAGFGLAVLAIALLNLPLILVLAIMKKPDAVKTSLICLGVLLLTGFSICSQAAFNIH